MQNNLNVGIILLPQTINRLPDLLLLIDSNGTANFYPVSKLAYKFHSSDPFFCDWFLYIASLTECCICGESHNPFVCPDIICDRCGMYKHHELICPFSTDELYTADKYPEDIFNVTLNDYSTRICLVDEGVDDTVINLRHNINPTLETLTDLMLDTYDYNEDPLLSSLDRKLEKKYNLSIPHEYLVIKDV